jgi:Anti-sigma-K factor rskA
MEPDNGRNDDTNIDDAHLIWSELAAGYALSSLDDADEADYLEHAADCPDCVQLAADLAEVVAELAFATPAVEPPASLKASIMRAVASDDVAQVTTASALNERRARKAGGSRLLRPIWAAAAVIVVLVAVGTGVVVNSSKHSTSVADQCAKVNCPTVALTASGRNVATVMVLNGTAWVAATGLPSTPSDTSYVLWRITGGTPVAVAAFTSTPNEGPVKVGPVTVPVSQVGSLAISQEKGQVLPSVPSDVLAQGVLPS